MLSPTKVYFLMDTPFLFVRIFFPDAVMFNRHVFGQSVLDSSIFAPKQNRTRFNIFSCFVSSYFTVCIAAECFSILMVFLNSFVIGGNSASDSLGWSLYHVPNKTLCIISNPTAPETVTILVINIFELLLVKS